jgi:hypothetical protein
MNKNSRILPADRRPQGIINPSRMNTAGRPWDVQKPRTVSSSPRTAPNKSGHPYNNNKTPYNKSADKQLKNKPINYRMQTVDAINKKKVKVKRRLSPEEIAAKKRRQELYRRKQIIYNKQLHEYKVKLFKEWFRVFLCRLMVLFVMFTSFLIITGVIFFMNLLHNGSPDTGVYTCQTGSDYDVIAVKTVKANLLFRNGVYYINVTDIASYCQFTTTGDLTQIRFISKGAGNDNVRFKINDAVIYVNGVRERLSAPIISEGDNIFVPVEFFDKYALGITVNVNAEERKITISRTFDEATSAIISEFETENSLRESKGETQKAVSELEVNIGYGDIEFTLRRDEPTENIDENSLGSNLLLITDPAYIASQKALADGTTQTDVTATQTNGTISN